LRLNPSPRRKLPLSLTPLIDVVFLLLIFFMLASTFLKFSAMPISGAAGGASAPGLDEIALIRLGGAGNLTVNGRSADLSSLRASLDDLIAKGVKRAVVRRRVRTCRTSCGSLKSRVRRHWKASWS